MIDITKPLELSDGTRVAYNPMTPAYASEEGWADFRWRDGGKAMCGNFMPADGTSRLSIDRRTLRNVRQPATGIECVERMEALARRIAARPAVQDWSIDGTNVSAEAREIVALLPEPIDSDLIEARRICSELCRFYAGNGAERPQWILGGKMDHDGDVQMVSGALKAARELALAERG